MCYECRMPNLKFLLHFIFLVMLVTDAHTNQLLKMSFSDSGEVNVNSTKSPIRKFDPKVILSISCMVRES